MRGCLVGRTLADEIVVPVVYKSCHLSWMCRIPQPNSNMVSTRRSRRSTSVSSPPPSPSLVAVSSTMPLPNNSSTALTTMFATPARFVTDPIRRQIENAGSPHVVTPPRPAGTSQSALVVASASEVESRATPVSGTRATVRESKVAKLARGESRTPAFITVSRIACTSRLRRVKADVARPSMAPVRASALSRLLMRVLDAGKLCFFERVLSRLALSIRCPGRLSWHRRDGVACYAVSLSAKCFSCASQRCSFVPERISLDQSRFYELVGKMETIADGCTVPETKELVRSVARDFRRLL